MFAEQPTAFIYNLFLKATEKKKKETTVKFQQI